MEVANTGRKVNAALIGSAGESHAVQVAGTREFIEMLSSNLYSRPKEAMIREVLCNADDAHKDAGYTGPIEIEIDDDNTLIIRDRGLGIPHDKMHIIYGTYGGSTKKSDSMATGGFGLGCKSPWSYTDAFTVSNAHGGTKTINTMVRVSNDHGGLPAIVPIASFDSGETGLEVRIDLKIDDVREIRELIKMIVYRGGMNATLNGEQMLTIDYSNEQSYTFIPNSHFRNKIMVRYGAVLYPVDRQEIYAEYYDGIADYIHPNHTLVLKAPPHSLVISPNRENVSYLEKTQKQLFKMLYEFMIEVNKSAIPYARKLIKKTNASYIARRGIGWMSTLNITNWLDAPTLDAEFYKLDVFGQIVHSKLTYEYPTEMHREALKHRFKMTEDQVNKGWQRRMYDHLRKMMLRDYANVTKQYRSYMEGYSGRNHFFKFVSREMIKVFMREGYDLTKLRYGHRMGTMVNGRSTQQPQPVMEMTHMGWESIDDQRFWLAAPVILTHTVKGIADDMAANEKPQTYYVYIIPRSGDVTADVMEKRLKEYGIPVINITSRQKLKVAAREKSISAFPTLGGLRDAKHFGHSSDNTPALCKIHFLKKDTYVQNPTVYMKVYTRSSNYVRSPVDGDYESYGRFQHLLPDDTAIVTTEADVSKLIKLGAIHWKAFIYNELVKMWSSVKFRQLFAWSNAGRTSRREFNVLMGSEWYRKTFNLPEINFDAKAEKKIQLFHSYWMSGNEYHLAASGVKDTAGIIPAIRAIRKQGEPKKLEAIRKSLRENPLIGTAVDIDSMLQLQEESFDQKIKDKINRIITIVME